MNQCLSGAGSFTFVVMIMKHCTALIFLRSSAAQLAFLGLVMQTKEISIHGGG